jgi:hypothetical protein
LVRNSPAHLVVFVLDAWRDGAAVAAASGCSEATLRQVELQCRGWRALMLESGQAMILWRPHKVAEVLPGQRTAETSAAFTELQLRLGGKSVMAGLVLRTGASRARSAGRHGRRGL